MRNIDGLRRFRHDNKHGMFTVDWSENQVKDFIDSADDLIDKGKIFKSDQTSTVSRTSFNETALVIKRYNNKGLSHSFLNTFRPSRAKKSCIKSRALLDLDIYTPSPLGFFVEKKRGLYFRSYFVMNYCPWPTLHSVILENIPSDRQWRNISNSIKTLLDRLSEHRITHGDLKQTNILVSDDRIGILDLDAMTLHRTPLTYMIKRSKDERAFQIRLMEEPSAYAERKKRQLNLP